MKGIYQTFLFQKDQDNNFVEFLSSPSFNFVEELIIPKFQDEDFESDIKIISEEQNSMSQSQISVNLNDSFEHNQEQRDFKKIPQQLKEIAGANLFGIKKITYNSQFQLTPEILNFLKQQIENKKLSPNFNNLQFIQESIKQFKNTNPNKTKEEFNTFNELVFQGYKKSQQFSQQLNFLADLGDFKFEPSKQPPLFQCYSHHIIKEIQFQNAGNISQEFINEFQDVFKNVETIAMVQNSNIIQQQPVTLLKYYLKKQTSFPLYSISKAVSREIQFIHSEETQSYNFQNFAIFQLEEMIIYLDKVNDKNFKDLFQIKNKCLTKWQRVIFTCWDESEAISQPLKTKQLRLLNILTESMQQIPYLKGITLQQDLERNDIDIILYHKLLNFLKTANGNQVNPQKFEGQKMNFEKLKQLKNSENYKYIQQLNIIDFQEQQTSSKINRLLIYDIHKLRYLQKICILFELRYEEFKYLMTLVLNSNQNLEEIQFLDTEAQLEMFKMLIQEKSNQVNWLHALELTKNKFIPQMVLNPYTLKYPKYPLDMLILRKEELMKYKSNNMISPSSKLHLNKLEFRPDDDKFSLYRQNLEFFESYFDNSIEIFITKTEGEENRNKYQNIDLVLDLMQFSKNQYSLEKLFNQYSSLWNQELLQKIAVNQILFESSHLKFKKNNNFQEDYKQIQKEQQIKTKKVSSGQNLNQSHNSYRQKDSMNSSSILRNPPQTNFILKQSQFNRPKQNQGDQNNIEEIQDSVYEEVFNEEEIGVQNLIKGTSVIEKQKQTGNIISSNYLKKFLKNFKNLISLDFSKSNVQKEHLKAVLEQGNDEKNQIQKIQFLRFQDCQFSNLKDFILPILKYFEQQDFEEFNQIAFQYFFYSIKFTGNINIDKKIIRYIFQKSFFYRQLLNNLVIQNLTQHYQGQKEYLKLFLDIIFMSPALNLQAFLQQNGLQGEIDNKIIENIYQQKGFIEYIPINKDLNLDYSLNLIFQSPLQSLDFLCIYFINSQFQKNISGTSVLHLNNMTEIYLWEEDYYQTQKLIKKTIQIIEKIQQIPKNLNIQIPDDIQKHLVKTLFLIQKSINDIAVKEILEAYLSPDEFYILQQIQYIKQICQPKGSYYFQQDGFILYYNYIQDLVGSINFNDNIYFNSKGLKYKIDQKLKNWNEINLGLENVNYQEIQQQEKSSNSNSLAVNYSQDDQTQERLVKLIKKFQFLNSIELQNQNIGDRFLVSFSSFISNPKELKYLKLVDLTFNQRINNSSLKVAYCSLINRPVDNPKIDISIKRQEFELLKDRYNIVQETIKIMQNRLQQIDREKDKQTLQKDDEQNEGQLFLEKQNNKEKLNKLCQEQKLIIWEKELCQLQARSLNQIKIEAESKIIDEKNESLQEVISQGFHKQIDLLLGKSKEKSIILAILVFLLATPFLIIHYTLKPGRIYKEGLEKKVFLRYKRYLKKDLYIEVKKQTPLVLKKFQYYYDYDISILNSLLGNQQIEVNKSNYFIHFFNL